MPPLPASTTGCGCAENSGRSQPGTTAKLNQGGTFDCDAKECTDPAEWLVRKLIEDHFAELPLGVLTLVENLFQNHGAADRGCKPAELEPG